MTTPPIQVWSSGLKILDDKPHYGSSKGLAHFLSKLSQRARDSGWVNITKTKGFDIFHKYGLFTIQDSRNDAVNRFQYDVVGNHIIMWDAHASWQMMTCLMNSCTPECLNKVRHSSEDHVITSSRGEVFEDEPLFLHILVSWVVVDKHSTVSYYSHQLTCLDQLMAKVNCNIINFNDKVQDVVHQLDSRGETVNHLMVNLFKGYEAMSDKEFVACIWLKKYKYNEGGGSIDADKLMTNAENQFMVMTRDKERHTPAKEIQEILALTAEIKALKEQFNNHNGKAKGTSRNEKQAWKKVKPKPNQASRGQDLQLVHTSQSLVHEQTKWVHLGMPMANAQTSSTEAMNDTKIPRVTLANSIAALRMDEAWLIAGARQCIFWLLTCIFFCLVHSGSIDRVHNAYAYAQTTHQELGK